MDSLKNTQQSTTYELSKKCLRAIYMLMTKGRSGHQGQLGKSLLK